MALVTISEATRLTGKARSTLHKYIRQGKLSTTTDSETGTKKVDTSELLRVFGNIQTTGVTMSPPVAKQQQTTPDETHALQVKLQLLEQENAHLKTEKALLEKNLDDVRQAMLLIESRSSPVGEQQPPPAAKKSWQFWKK